MTTVMRPSCWHKNFGPNGLSAPAQGLCLNFFSSITTDFNISSALRWAIQDQWSSGFTNFMPEYLHFWLRNVPIYVVDAITVSGKRCQNWCHKFKKTSCMRVVLYFPHLGKSIPVGYARNIFPTYRLKYMVFMSPPPTEGEGHTYCFWADPQRWRWCSFLSAL